MFTERLLCAIQDTFMCLLFLISQNQLKYMLLLTCVGVVVTWHGYYVKQYQHLKSSLLSKVCPFSCSHQSWLLSFSDTHTGMFLNSRVFGYYKISFKTEVARILVVDAVGKTVDERRLGKPLLFSILFWHWSKWGFPTFWIFGCLLPASAAQP